MLTQGGKFSIDLKSLTLFEDRISNSTTYHYHLIEVINTPNSGIIIISHPKSNLHRVK